MIWVRRMIILSVVSALGYFFIFHFKITALIIFGIYGFTTIALILMILVHSLLDRRLRKKYGDPPTNKSE